MASGRNTTSRTWRRHRAFRRNPALVHDFYNGRRKAHADVAPNAAHAALARLESEYPGAVTIVTQNIDALHEAAGSKNLIHMHGELLAALCAFCAARHRWTDDLSLDVACPSCGRQSGLRPDVVWFGEMPYHMERSANYSPRPISSCPSAPAATSILPRGLSPTAGTAGAHTVELNLEPSEGVSHFDEVIHGRATEIVPAYVERSLEYPAG